LCPIESGWAETAWNGFILGHPASWEITRLERDQIQWGDGARAALEVRWDRLKGRHDADREFKRFVRRARRKGLPRPESWPVPQSWRSALSRFRVTGFSWRPSESAGRGLLIYCPHCRRHSLIQIHPCLAEQPDLLPPLLASLHDHPRGEEIPLSLFGIRARLPGGVRLTRFRFEAGRYRLYWRGGNSHIELHRWAPARVVLERQPLAVFTAGQFQMAPADFTATRQNGFPAVTSEGTQGHRLRAILRPYGSQRLVRVWHVPDRNTLLGMAIRFRGRVRGPSGDDALTTLFNRLADAYETC
jgi:hypothetical protein